MVDWQISLVGYYSSINTFYVTSQSFFIYDCSICFRQVANYLASAY